MDSKKSEDDLKFAAQEIVNSSSYKQILKKHGIKQSDLVVKFQFSDPCTSKKASSADKQKILDTDKNPSANCIICYYDDQGRYTCTDFPWC